MGKLHLAWFDDYQMRDITPLLLDQWWQNLKDKGLAPHYRNDILGWLKALFNYAYQKAVIDALPRSWPAPADEPEPDIEDYLTEDEQLRILDALPKHDRPIFDFMFLTGCRVNEACGLQRSDTDWNKGHTIIKHTIKCDGSLGLVKNKKKRVVPHFPELVELLRKDSKVSGLNHYQFVNEFGRRYSAYTMRDTFRRACKETIGRQIKLKNSTRHSIGMQLLGKGYNIWQVSKFLNHSSIKMTEHYAKMRTKELAGMYGRTKGGQKDKNRLVSR